MVIQLEAKPRPLVQFTLCRDAAQLPLWDAKLDYRSSTIPDRLLAYGVAISEEGSYLCGEIGPFESHPLLRQMMTSWDLFRSRRTRRRILRWWPDQAEADRIERSICLLHRRPGQRKLRAALTRIWDANLPAVTMYSIDGERTWKPVDPEGEKWMPRLRKRLAGQKTIDPGETCLMLSDRNVDTKETDRKQWLKQRLSSRASDSSIYTPAHQAYSQR